MNTLTMPLQPPTPAFDQDIKPSAAVLNSVPAWGSYLYQNFLLPAFSPSEWVNNTPSNMNTTNDYFGNAAAMASTSDLASWPSFNNMNIKTEPLDNFAHAPATAPLTRSITHPQPNMAFNYSTGAGSGAGPSMAGPSYFNMYQQPPTSIPTSLLMMQSNSSNISPSVDVVDAQMVRSPSPVDSHVSPHHSPVHGTKRRALSLDSDSHDEHDHDHDHDHDEVAEGVERDGMIWGMRVEDYRALSARERKRVRNRISARTFRAKRKEHLSLLENDLESKDVQIKLAKDESARLRQEVANLKKRLSKYESI